MADERSENEAEIVTLTDETGKETDFEILGIKEIDGTVYYALLPLEDNEAGEYVILKIETDENGEDMLVTIDDDEEFDRVADIIEDEFFSEIDYDEGDGE